MSMSERQRTRKVQQKTKWIQNDQNGVTIIEDRKKKIRIQEIRRERKTRRDGTKRRNEGKVSKWQEVGSLTSVSKATS